MSLQQPSTSAIRRGLDQTNWRAVWGIMRKDLRVVGQSKSVVLPMIIIPLIFVVLLPLGISIGFRYFGAMLMASSDFKDIVEVIPASLRAQLPDLNVLQITALYALRYMFAPMHLILPIMTTSVIAADSFAGEKERKTLEALLYTPTSDFDLMLAKMLGALIPGILVAWIGAVTYWIVVDIAAWPIFGRAILPDTFWLVLMLWVAPAAAALGLGATVIVSGRAKSFQDASQISGLVVLPVAILMVAQSTGLVFLSIGMSFLIGLVFWLAALVLFVIGARTLRRSELLARL